MPTTRFSSVALLATLAAALASAGAHAAGDGKASIAVASLDRPLKAGDLSDGAWKRIPPQAVTVTTAFPGHPSITGDAKGKEIKVQAAGSKDSIYVRLQWQDSVPNKDEGIGRFADGIAIQLPMHADAEASPFMGGDGKMVSIWYWNAATNTAQTLVANGFGTLTKAEVQTVAATGGYSKGIWTVVFQIPRNDKAGEGIDLGAVKAGELPVAFAVWDGGNQERDGFKAVTLEWQHLRF